MDRQILEGKTRKILGRKVKTLRREGFVPANIYGKKIKSCPIQVKADDFKRVFAETGETGLISLRLSREKGKEERTVLVSNVQYDPVSDTPIHVDFRQVDLKEKVTAAVPIEIIGESPAEKTGIGTVVKYMDEVEVEALPGNFPEKFSIDASLLGEVDQSVKVKDLNYDKSKITIKSEPETIIVKIEPPQKEEEIVPPSPEVSSEDEVAVEETLEEREISEKEEKDSAEEPDAER